MQVSAQASKENKETTQQLLQETTAAKIAEAQYKVDIAQLQTSLKEEHATKETLCASIAALEQQVQDIARSKATVEFSMTNLQEDVEAFTANNETLEQECSQLKTDLELSVTLNEEITNQLETTKTKHTDDVVQLESISRSLEQEIANKNTVLQDMQAELNMNEYQHEQQQQTHAHDLEQLHQSLFDADVVACGLKEQVSAAMKEAEQFQVATKEADQNKNHAMEEANTAAKEVADALHQVAQVQQLHMAIKEELAVTTERLNVLVLQNASLETSLSTRNKETEKFQMEMKQMDAAIQSMESETAAAHKHTSDAVGAANVAASAAGVESDKLRAMVDGLNHMVEAKEQEMVVLQSKHDMVVQQFQDEKNQLKETNSETLRNLGHVKNQLDTATSQLAGHNNHKQKIRMHEQLKQENTELRHQNTELITSVEQLKQEQLVNNKKILKYKQFDVKPVVPVVKNKRMPFGVRNGNVMAQPMAGMGLMMGELKHKLNKKSKDKEIVVSGTGIKDSTNDMVMSRPARQKKVRKKKQLLRPFQDDEVAETW